jgi:hypothetical protein
MRKLTVEDKPTGTLQEEIEMLRSVIRQAYQIVQEIEDPAEKLRGLNVIGTAAARVANLVQTQHQLTGGQDNEIAQAIDYAIREAARRLEVKL